MNDRMMPRGAGKHAAWEGVALLQGLVYLGTGLWPLLHMPSFLKVTGPKMDLWLVNTVGALISVIGAVLALAGVRGAVSREIALLGAASAASLSAIDVIYVARRRIRPVYLLDAVAEVALILGWVRGARLRSFGSHKSRTSGLHPGSMEIGEGFDEP